MLETCRQAPQGRRWDASSLHNGQLVCHTFAEAVVLMLCLKAEAAAAAITDASTNMALFSQAGLLGIRPKLFAAAPERFEADDFYR